MKVRRTMSQNVLLAGFYGGMAEVVWIAVYCLFTGQSSAEVARQVASTLASGAAAGASGVAAGIAIHFALSAIVAMVYVQLVWRPFARHLNEAAGIVVACVALGLIWTMNFLLVLPAVNPAFVTLVPYSISFASKILFGIAMAGSLRDGVRRRADQAMLDASHLAV